jgi:hypothetical protein
VSTEKFHPGQKKFIPLNFLAILPIRTEEAPLRATGGGLEAERGFHGRPGAARSGAREQPCASEQQISNAWPSA